MFDDAFISVVSTRSAHDDISCPFTETFWEVISVPESKAYRYVDTKGEQFVRYTRYKLCRIYPAGYRIDSSNPNPQAFWNCGCQLGKDIFIAFSFAILKDEAFVKLQRIENGYYSTAQK